MTAPSLPALGTIVAAMSSTQGLAPVLAKTADQLTVADLNAVASTLGMKGTFTPDHLPLVLGFLKAENIDRVSDIVARPELLGRLKDFFTPEADKPIGIIQCPHCLMPFLMEPQA